MLPLRTAVLFFFPALSLLPGQTPGLGGQALGVAEHGHVNIDLRDDCHGDPVANTGDLLEQTPLCRVRLGLLLNALVEGA